ncbi:unnamed protein product [Oncorhynchus mykiss]|uniref:Uncharacterized protein n=1 Tax=Oncorhynchus mykiss TaxID=8022 RepID=A0A060XCV9_ONCMY|nr:unnamed protein product [Oncorhynchus mykiss]
MLQYGPVMEVCLLIPSFHFLLYKVTWTSLPLQPSIWPGEPVLMMLDDLEFQWQRGRLPNLLPAMELVMWVVLSADSPDKVCVFL